MRAIAIRGALILVIVCLAFVPRPGHLLLPTVAAGGAPPPGSGPVDVKGFVRVIDGDTADVWISGNEAAIGAIGIAAPQANTSCGRAAAGQLQGLVKAGVHLDEDKTITFDSRSRRMYYWSTPDGRDIALLLVQAGVVHADGTGKNAAALGDAETKAKAAKTGCLWNGDPSAVRPSRAPAAVKPPPQPRRPRPRSLRASRRM